MWCLITVIQAPAVYVYRKVALTYEGYDDKSTYITNREQNVTPEKMTPISSCQFQNTMMLFCILTFVGSKIIHIKCNNTLGNIKY